MNYILSNWMRIIAWRIGKSTAIDFAVDCFLKCVVSFAYIMPESAAMIHKANVRALRNIREVCDADQLEFSGEDFMWAVYLLYHVEVCKFVNSFI